MPTKPDTELITAAILGYEEQMRQIVSKIAELRAMLSGTPASPAASPEGRMRKRSAATRRRMALAQKKRWAAIKGTSPAPPKSKATKAKRKISPEGMQRIIAAQKKRWRLARAAKKG
jgi:hypothetical protein